MPECAGGLGGVNGCKGLARRRPPADGGSGAGCREGCWGAEVPIQRLWETAAWAWVRQGGPQGRMGRQARVVVHPVAA